MNATPTFGRLGDHAVDRRRFLGLIATGAAVVGIPGLLTACSTTRRRRPRAARRRRAAT